MVRRLLAVTALFLAASALALGQGQGEKTGRRTDLEEALLAAGHDEEWVMSFQAAWQRMGGARGAYDDAAVLLLGLGGSAWLTGEPGEAAGRLVRAARALEIRLRSGEPQARVRVRAEWMLRLAGARGVAVRQGLGAEDAPGFARLERVREEKEERAQGDPPAGVGQDDSGGPGGPGDGSAGGAETPGGSPGNGGPPGAPDQPGGEDTPGSGDAPGSGPGPAQGGR